VDMQRDSLFKDPGIVAALRVNVYAPHHALIAQEFFLCLKRPCASRFCMMRTCMISSLSERDCAKMKSPLLSIGNCCRHSDGCCAFAFDAFSSCAKSLSC
jgi:hypothetical protein